MCIGGLCQHDNDMTRSGKLKCGERSVIINIPVYVNRTVCYKYSHLDREQIVFTLVSTRNTFIDNEWLLQTLYFSYNTPYYKICLCHA